jgi:hypothetical protein
MAQRDPHADPYLDSGRRAATQSVVRMKCEALKSSISDADELTRRAHTLMLRSARQKRAAWAAMIAALLGCTGLAVAAGSAVDGTYEGVLLANWAILGCFICIGVFGFASGWYSKLRRLRETAQRLQTRAEYQRKLATLQLAEIEHEALR